MYAALAVVIVLSRISNWTSSLISVWVPSPVLCRYSDTRESVVYARTSAVYTAGSIAVHSRVVALDHTSRRTVSFAVIPVFIRYAIFIAAFVLRIYCELLSMNSVETQPFWRNFRTADW